MCNSIYRLTCICMYIKMYKFKSWCLSSFFLHKRQSIFFGGGVLCSGEIWWRVYKTLVLFWGGGYFVLEKFNVQDIVKKLGLLYRIFFFSFIEIDIDKFSIKVAFDPIMGIFFQNELNAIDIIEFVEQSIYD